MCTPRLSRLHSSKRLTLVIPLGTGSNTLRCSSRGIWECSGRTLYRWFPRKTQGNKHFKNPCIQVHIPFTHYVQHGYSFSFTHLLLAHTETDRFHIYEHLWKLFVPKCGFISKYFCMVYIKFQPGKKTRTAPGTFRVSIYFKRASMSSKGVSFSFNWAIQCFVSGPYSSPQIRLQFAYRRKKYETHREIKFSPLLIL